MADSPGQAWGDQMNPVTLRFYRNTLEMEFRAARFQSSYKFTVFVLAMQIPAHVFFPLYGSEYRIISLIYGPIIALVLFGRWYLSGIQDQALAHRYNMDLWVGALIVGNTLQRAIIFVGWHPRIEISLSFLYMTNYFFVVLGMHLMYFDIKHKIVGITSIFLSLATAGWSFTGDEGWTAVGQPYDTLIIGIPLIVGSLCGYAIELMMRSAFLERTGALTSEETEMHHDMHANNFVQLGCIGRGGSGEVFLVRKQDFKFHADDATGGLYALKRVVKNRLSPSQLQRVIEETEILKSLSHPFVVSLHYAFQSEHCFYLAMTYASGGDLARWCDRITVAGTQLVAAEVLLALEYLHTLQIIYRDVKPENTLLAHDGHILLADFGVSKQFNGALDSFLQFPGSPQSPRASTKSQVGTIEYMAPELFDGLTYSYEVDFWGLAVMLHEILTGFTIGSAKAPNVLRESLDEICADLLTELLEINPQKRLGCLSRGGAKGIQNHEYFRGIDWAAVLAKKVPGPLHVPKVTVHDTDGWVRSEVSDGFKPGLAKRAAHGSPNFT